jgi:DNA-binding NarL/FixJ family response regulator
LKYGVIVEDLPDAREWLRAALQDAFPGISVVAAPTLADARREIAEQVPDIALVDIGLPDGSGIDLIDALNRNHPQVMSIVTSVFDDDAHLFAALGAGASGYLLKDQGRQELTTMLQKIADGQPPLSPSMARHLLAFFAPRETPEGPPLTAREREVLGLIAKGYSSPKVADMLDISKHTAAGYVKTIYSKLNISSRAEAAMQASRMGIVGVDVF